VRAEVLARRIRHARLDRPLRVVGRNRIGRFLVDPVAGDLSPSAPSTR
jgi:hypothetical protein